MRREPAPDELVGRIAARQHGVVTQAQLISCGVTSSGISRRIARGRLHRVHRGVYAVGHEGLSLEGKWMAAVKACRPGAVLSHRSAGALWRITPRSAVPIEVSVPGRAGRERRKGIQIHRPSLLLPSQTTLRNAIPVTKPDRTLVDLRRVLPGEQFAAALRQAEYLRLPIGGRVQPDHTRSELEAVFLRLCRRHHLPRPEVNVRVGRFVVDFLWRERHLVVETDGYRAHGTRTAFEGDRARDAELMQAGYVIVRLTWRQLTEDAANAAATIRSLLKMRPGQTYD